MRLFSNRFIGYAIKLCAINQKTCAKPSQQPQYEKKIHKNTGRAFNTRTIKTHGTLSKRAMFAITSAYDWGQGKLERKHKQKHIADRNRFAPFKRF